jgi:hypothetical protein
MLKLSARIASTSQRYASGLERWTVDVPISQARDLPLPRGREEIELAVGRQRYAAGIRTTRGYVNICPNMVDGAGERTNLSTVLSSLGWTRNQQLMATVDGHRWMLSAD